MILNCSLKLNKEQFHLHVRNTYIFTIMTTQRAHTYDCEWFISRKNSGLYLIADLDISEDDRYKPNGKHPMTMSRKDLVKY